MSDEKTLDEQLAEIDREERAEAAEAKEVEKRRRVERHGLKKRFEKELGGKEGRAFSIIDTIEGFVVVKKGPGVLLKQLRADVNPDSIDAFFSEVIVHPDKETAAKWRDRSPGISDLLWIAASRLYGVSNEDNQKK
jgi:hypothetical protein